MPTESQAVLAAVLGKALFYFSDEDFFHSLEDSGWLESHQQQAATIRALKS